MTDWEKRARELLLREFSSSRASDMPYWREPDHELRAAVQLGREMADERAEEIAQRCDEILKDATSATGTTSVIVIAGLSMAARIARSTSASKTREQVLEEALRSIANGYNGYADDKRECEDVARSALDWKP